MESVETYPENIQSALSQLDINIDTRITKNLLVILEEFQKIDSYNYLSIAYIVHRDDECISFEWPKKSIFCCIYDESIEIDNVMSSNGTIIHRTKEFFSSQIKDATLRLKELLLLLSLPVLL